MLTKCYSLARLKGVGLLCAGLSFWVGGVSTGLAFQETFDSYAEGESIIGADWELQGAGGLSNDAIVQGGGYVSVTSQGNATGTNARVASRQITSYMPRQVTDTDSNHVEVDIRWVSPGSRNESLTHVYMTLSGGAHSMNMGFFMDSGVRTFFLDFGSGNRAKSPWYAEVFEDRWYRFVVDLIPSTGDFSFEVIDIDANETVWSGTNITEGLASFSPVEWRALVLTVTRAGSSPSVVQSADFDNISIPGLAPAFDQPVGANLAQAVALDFETVEGQYYQIETSTDRQNWVPEGNVLIGKGTPVQRYYSTDEGAPRFFRVVTE